MREKLIELLLEANRLCERTSCALCVGNGKGEGCIDHLTAEHLIANGVVILPNAPIGLVKDSPGSGHGFGTDVFCPHCGTNLSGYYGDKSGDIIQCFENTKVLTHGEAEKLIRSSDEAIL